MKKKIREFLDSTEKLMNVADYKADYSVIKTKINEIEAAVTRNEVSSMSRIKSKESEIEKIHEDMKKKESKYELDIQKLKKLIEQSVLSLRESQETKTDINKELNILKTTLKDVDDRLFVQSEQIKEKNTSIEVFNNKLVELEKKDFSKTSSLSGESSKLSSLTKAIDTIQDNSRSLENMVKNMKSEFATQKDIEKFRSEIFNKGATKVLDPNHPDIGPIMDSLIMTNDRPFVDCTTLTPMTGNGLVKFERFTASNKLPWDEINDQFVIQEPGVYSVNISGILQDAFLSVKISSSVLEREVCCVGSRDGVIGVQSPVFVSRSGLFQIEDDDNVCETVLIEIQAENEDSFIDKNFCLTLFKIAEANGSE